MMKSCLPHSMWKVEDMSDTTFGDDERSVLSQTAFELAPCVRKNNTPSFCDSNEITFSDVACRTKFSNSNKIDWMESIIDT